MASNPYNNKIELADGTVLMDLTSDTVAADKMLSGYTAHDKSGAAITGSIQSNSGGSITPTRQQQTVSVSGKYMTGNIVVAAIPDTYYTMEEAMALMFPVGSIYISTSSTAPSFGGTWQEVLMTQTLDQQKDNMHSYATGTGTGTLHFWKRTA